MERRYELKGTERSFFTMYVELMTVQSPIDRLRRQERQVLAEVMYRNSLLAKDYRDPEDPKKWRALFSYESKREMAEALKMSDAGFANCLTALRRHRLMDADNYLHRALRLYPGKMNAIVFSFKVKDEVGSEV
jgi:hypothetical protein